MPEKQHFATLDALRAVAAIAVTIFHLSKVLPVAPASAFLAVDMFFVLSGFVIGHAYEGRLAAGLSFTGFMRLRIIRLWPLFGLGTVLACGMYTLSALVSSGGTEPQTVLARGFANLLFLPIITAGVPMFLNPPAWSLMFEMIANAAYAATRNLLTTPLLVAIIAIGWLGNIYFALNRGTLDLGAEWSDLLPGLSRVAFSFFLGLALYRTRRRWAFMARLPPWVVMVLLVGTLMAPFHHVAYDLAFVTLISPLLVMLGASYKPVRGSLFLGEMSFVLYILHRPIQIAAVEFAPKFGIPPLAAGIAVVVLLVVATPVITRIYDRPLRNLLSRITKRKTAYQT